jgi:hypothetical protein
MKLDQAQENEAKPGRFSYSLIFGKKILIGKSK